MRHIIFFVPIILSIPFLIGCGGAPTLRTEYVEGIITMDGSPLANVTVAFSPKSSTGKFASGITDAAGKYTLTAMQGGANGKGTLQGEYVVLVTKIESQPITEPNKNAIGITQQATTKNVNTLPAVYSDVKAAKLTATVAAGKNKFDFDISSKEK